jgi:hypothetical protein
VVTRDRPDFGIEALLNLHGWIHEVGGGFWISVKAIRVAPDSGRPHGISYSLTMHGPSGDRIVGFDNAHLPYIGAGPARKSQRKERGSDHRHFRGRVAWYDFVSPEKLMEDFWDDVQRVMEEEGVPWTG